MAQRILRGAAATLVYDHLNADGEAVAATGTLTVEVTTADGTVVKAAGSATTPDGDVTGRYTVTLTPAQTSSLNLLTATWTDSAAPTVGRTTEHEIVGGYIFSLADVRGHNPNLEAEAEYAAPLIIAKRLEVEDEVEDICDVAFVPRYRRVFVDGSGSHEVLAGVHMIRTVRSCRIYASTGSSSYTSLSAAQLAGLVVTRDGLVRRTDGGTFDYGLGNIVLEVEHGYTTPPADLRTAVLDRLHDRLMDPNSAIPSRARAYTAADGFSYELTRADEFSTGIASVDAVYQRYSMRKKNGGDAAPASRTLNFDPQWGGLYRGGIQ